MANEFAGEGWVFVCAACGKRSKDLYGDQKLNYGWDESCMLNAVLCEEGSVILDPNGYAISGKAVGWESGEEMNLISGHDGSMFFFADGDDGRLLAKIDLERIAEPSNPFKLYRASSFQRGAAGNGFVQKDLGTYKTVKAAMSAVEKELNSALSGLYGS